MKSQSPHVSLKTVAAKSPPPDPSIHVSFISAVNPTLESLSIPSKNTDSAIKLAKNSSPARKKKNNKSKNRKNKK